MAETVDRVRTPILKVLDLPNGSLKMQGTIGVLSDITFQEVLEHTKMDESWQTFQKLWKKYEQEKNLELPIPDLD
jgi:hypothetical protein